MKTGFIFLIALFCVQIGRAQIDTEKALSQYDSVGTEFLTDVFLVYKNQKQGLFNKTKGELVPPVYDSIISDYNGFYCKKDNLIGLINLFGKVLIEPKFDRIFGFYTADIILVIEQGILKKYNVNSGQQTALEPSETIDLKNNSVVRFENYSYFVETATYKYLNGPFYELSSFNDGSFAVAKPVGSDYTIAINTAGENLKPNFHLETKNLLSRYIFDTVSDTVYYYLNQAHLLDGIAVENYKTFIEDNYFMVINYAEYYNEFGDFYPAYYMDVYEKASYFDFASAFPSKPYYAFNFYDYYYRLGAKNQAGWQWAIPKTKNAEGYYFLDGENKVPLSFCVLVNDQGEVKQKTNYHPVESLPFFTISIPNEIDWEKPETFEPLRDTLNHFFPSLKQLANTDFGQRMKDSVFTTHLGYESYVETADNYYDFTYEYHFYRTQNLQLFNYPPPTTIRYEFLPTDYTKIESAQPLHGLPNLEKFRIGDKRAYSFGTYRYFIAPILYPEWTEQERKEAISNLIKTYPQAQIQQDLTNYAKYEPLIKMGIARVSYSHQFDQELMNTLANASEQLQVYQYTTTLNLVYENKVILEPKYRLAALDTTTGKPRFLLVDTSLNLNWYDLESGKLTKIKDEQLEFADGASVITRSPKSKTFNCYTKAEIPDNGYWSEQWFTPSNARNIIRFAYYEQATLPYSTMWGEDSVMISEDGTIFNVYPPADTVIYSYYNHLTPNFNRAYYQTADGKWHTWFNNEAVQFNFSKYALSAQMPLNFTGYRHFVIEVKNDNVIFSNDKGASFQINEKDYLKLKDQPIRTNGYGGAVIKGVYYSYQNLLPFPEKHTITIGIDYSCYLIGGKNRLELVRLDENNVIVKRCTQLFTSYADYLEKFATAVNEGDPIYDFWFR